MGSSHCILAMGHFKSYDSQSVFTRSESPPSPFAIYILVRQGVKKENQALSLTLPPSVPYCWSLRPPITLKWTFPSCYHFCAYYSKIKRSNDSVDSLLPQADTSSFSTLVLPISIADIILGQLLLCFSEPAHEWHQCLICVEKINEWAFFRDVMRSQEIVHWYIFFFFLHRSVYLQDLPGRHWWCSLPRGHLPWLSHQCLNQEVRFLKYKQQNKCLILQITCTCIGISLVLASFFFF